MPTTYDMLAGLYGVETYPVENPEVTQVETTVTLLAPGDPMRTSLLITNLGANSVYIAPSNDPSATKGIFLAANGGNIIIQWERDLGLVVQPWYGIAIAAASACYVLASRISP